MKDDLEAGIIPVHVHVETAITKGKYGEYDTFLAEEAVEYLRLYIEARRRATFILTLELKKSTMTPHLFGMRCMRFHDLSERSRSTRSFIHFTSKLDY